jgi:anthranilate/para-aminobenzoate synthase component I
MRLSITKQEFIETCRQGVISVLSLEIPFRKPSDVYERVMGKNSALLESAKGPERIARYSFIAFDPYLEVRVKNNVVETISGKTRGISFKKPLEKLKEILGAYPQKVDPSLPPFQGGAIGILGYDFVHYFEKLPRTCIDDLKIPDAHFMIVDRIISFDHREERAWIVVCPGARRMRLGYNEIESDYSSMFDEAESELHRIRTSLADGEVLHQKAAGPFGKREILYEMKRSSYLDIVARAKEYIRAGDIFQANLAQRLSADISGIRPWNIYRKLIRINPSPFGAFIAFEDYSIASSSPERLVRYKDGVADTRPIAGTRPRGRNCAEDEHMRQELLLNEKERAEHIMLIDLERNDLGKVCSYGTVEVDELLITEEYSHVIHIVSNIRGVVSPAKDSFDLIRAVFPGGTITGVPKVRCMEIIDELESVARGAYTGSLGYIGFDGTMDLNIVIRTFVCKDERAYIHAGAGIVADSDPDREYHETLKKAEALIKTLFEFS